MAHKYVFFFFGTEYKGGERGMGWWTGGNVVWCVPNER